MNKPARTVTTKSAPKQFHYILISAKGWCQRGSVTACINDLYNDGSLPKGIKGNLYLVPCHVDTQYDISWFQPMYKGAQAIAVIEVERESQPLLVVDVHVSTIASPKPVLIQGESKL